MAANGRLIIDTPVAQIQSTAPAAGIGSLAFSIFTFGLIHELKAASADIALLDDGTINYKDLKHGVFEIVTKGDNPRVIVVDDPGETIVLRPSGGGFSVEQSQTVQRKWRNCRAPIKARSPPFRRDSKILLFNSCSERLTLTITSAQLQSNPNAQLQTNPNAQPQSNPSSTASAGSSTPPSNLNINNDSNDTTAAINSFRLKTPLDANHCHHQRRRWVYQQ